MTELIPADAIYYERLNTVAEMTLTGSSIAEIARELGVTRKVAQDLQNDWKESAIVSHETRDRALDALNIMDEHYNKLIKNSYKALEQIEDDIELNGTTPQRIQQKLNGIKLVADLEAKRLDALQKAGLLDAAEMGDHVADMEHKVGILADILRNDLCPDCKRKVAAKLQQVTGQVEAVVVYDE
jgi:predicted transcriptional regulator